MAERSAAALHWALAALALWSLARLLPATGSRRKVPMTIRTVATTTKGNVEGYPILTARVLSPRRSPYSTDRAPLDGSASRLSRPYLPALTESLASGTATALRAARVRPYSLGIRISVPASGCGR